MQAFTGTGCIGIAGVASCCSESFSTTVLAGRTAVNWKSQDRMDTRPCSYNYCLCRK